MNEIIIHDALTARLGDDPRIHLSDAHLDPAAIRAVLISEVVPADPAQDFHGAPDGAYLASALPLFRQAGLPVQSFQDLLDLGVYITNAVKLPKDSYAVSQEAMDASLPFLEAELALFPNLQMILLMGDVAKKMVNRIARKATKKNVIPSGATYKIRSGEYHWGSIRVLPSYIITGGNLLIEKSKVRMITEDLAVLAAMLNQQAD